MHINEILFLVMMLLLGTYPWRQSDGWSLASKVESPEVHDASNVQ